MGSERGEHGASGRGLPPRLDPRAGRPAQPRGSSASGRGAAPAGRRGTVVARACAAAVSAVVLTGSGWGWYLGQVAEAGVHRTDAIPDTGNADADGAPEAVNLLLVGNDSRADLTPEQLEELNAGVDSGTNTDTMILVHVPADGSGASFVSFPRDSFVDIPGHGPDKLNAAYSYGYAATGAGAADDVRRAGGQQLLVQTISELTGMQIDHYAEVDLLGFFELTSVVGGVEVNLCAPVDDSAYSGAVFDAGPQTIEGADALRFVRQRYGVRPDGSPALPRGDLDRIVRQQVFIGGVVRRMLSQDVLFDLGTQRRLVEAASKSLTVDQDLRLLDLAQQLQSVTPDSIRFETVPVADSDARDEQGRSIVRLADDQALRAFFAELSADEEVEEPAAPEPATVAPSEVPVAVYNGAGIPGLAGEVTTELGAAGFPVVSTGNADRSDYARTTIRHAAGDEALAATLAAQVPGAAVEAVDDAAPGTVQLVLGADFRGLGEPTARPEPAAGPATPRKPRTAADTGCIN